MNKISTEIEARGPADKWARFDFVRNFKVQPLFLVRSRFFTPLFIKKSGKKRVRHPSKRKQAQRLLLAPKSMVYCINIYSNDLPVLICIRSYLSKTTPSCHRC